MTITRKFECFHYLKFEASFLKNENLFLETEVSFFS